MATKNITRRAAIAGLFALALPLNVQAQGYTPKPFVLESATRTNLPLREKVYASAEMIRKATLRTDHEAYVSATENPFGFDYSEEGMGVLLRPTNSQRTYFASCNHVWDFERSEHNGVEKTLKAAAKRGAINPKKEDIKERMKVAGYTVNPSKGVHFDKKRDLSVLDVTDLMPALENLSTPLPLDTNESISHGIGSKVFWLSQNSKEFPFVEANIIYDNVFYRDPTTGEKKSIEKIETDAPISFESGRPVFNRVNGQPNLAGIITSRIESTKGGPLNRAVFSSARHIINAIRNYEMSH